MHWPDGGTPSCHEGRQVREVKNSRGGETGAGAGTGEDGVEQPPEDEK